MINHVLLPSLSLLMCNAHLSEEVWLMIKCLPYQTRCVVKCLLQTFEPTLVSSTLPCTPIYVELVYNLQPSLQLVYNCFTTGLQPEIITQLQVVYNNWFTTRNNNEKNIKLIKRLNVHKVDRAEGKSNLHHTRGFTPKRVTSGGVRRSGDEPLATLCPI